MRLESVRSLKEELFAFGRNGGVGRFDALSTGVCIPAGVALGVVPGSKLEDWRLAVRLHYPSPQALSFATRVRARAPKEIDAQFVGPVFGPRAVRAGAPILLTRGRPLYPGLSLGHYESTAGTLGAFAYNSRGKTVILSNNHVLCTRNYSFGDSILQPGPADGGSYPYDTVAFLDSAADLRFDGTNYVDAAIAAVGAIQCSPLYGGGELAGIRRDPVAGLRVWKVGRTTGFTRGVVRAIEVDGVEVRYGDRIAVFDNQVEIAGIDGAFSDGGDSGSLILDGNRQAVALLFAGAPIAAGKAAVTFANPISVVTETLGLRLI